MDEFEENLWSDRDLERVRAYIRKQYFEKKRSTNMMDPIDNSWEPLDLTDLVDLEGDQDIEEEYANAVGQKIEPVTWRQRVYLTWLTLIALQNTIATNNKVTIGAVIDAKLREASVSGHRFRKIEAHQRVRECLAIVRHLVKRGDDEN